MSPVKDLSTHPLRWAGVLDPLETSEGLSALEVDLSAHLTVLSGALMEVVSPVEGAVRAVFPAEAIALEASVVAVHPVVSPVAATPVAELIDNHQSHLPKKGMARSPFLPCSVSCDADSTAVCFYWTFNGKASFTPKLKGKGGSIFDPAFIFKSLLL